MSSDTCQVASDVTGRQAETLLTEEYLRRRHGVESSSTLSLGFILDHPVSSVRIERALQRLVDRHELLRTAFVPSVGRTEEDRLRAVRGIPVRRKPAPGLFSKIVASTAPIVASRHATVVDFSDLAAAVRATIVEQSRARFDYSRPPHLRASVIDGNGGAIGLAITVPRLICDRRSLRLLALDFQDQLAGCAEGVPPIAGRGSIDHSPAAVFPLATAERNVCDDEGSRYWQGRLSAFRSLHFTDQDIPLALPPLLPSFEWPGRPGFCAGEFPGLADVVRVAATQCAVTCYAFCLAAYALAIHEFTSRRSFPIWIEVPPRNGANLVGDFDYRHMAALTVAGCTAGSAVVRSVAEVIDEVQRYRDFDVREVEAIRGRPIGQRTVQLMFDCSDSSPATFRKRWITSEISCPVWPCHIDTATHLRRDGMSVMISFDRSIFSETSAARLLDSYSQSVSSLAASLGDERRPELSGH